MAIAQDLWRGLATLAFFYGLAPLACHHCVRADADRARARELIRAHLASARRRGGIRLDVQPPLDPPLPRRCVLVYNQTSPVDDMADLEVLWALELDFCVIAAEYTWLPYFRPAGERAGIVFLAGASGSPRIGP